MARPRAFKEEEVIFQIIQLFWEKGFESTSLDDVIRATGLQKGSLYSCFGNKEKLFRLALETYSCNGPFYVFKEIESPIGRLAKFYTKLISDANDRTKQRRGCFVFNSSLEFGNKKGSLSAYVANIGKRNEGFFHELMKEAKNKDEISSDINEHVAAERAHAAAFTIREMSKFKNDKDFLSDIANSLFYSIGAKERVFLEDLR